MTRIDKLILKVQTLKEMADYYRALGPEYQAEHNRAMAKYQNANKKLWKLLDDEDSS